MTTVKDVLKILSEWAPEETAMERDTVGLLVGREDATVTRVMVSLDITSAVIDEALEKGCELIAAHHPLYRKTVPFLLTNTDENGGALALQLCENRVAAICMHTNLDAAKGGVNDRLAAVLGLCGYDVVLDEESGIGRCGVLPEPVSIEGFAKECKQRLSTGSVRFCSSGKPVLRVAVCGGSGSDTMKAALAKGCDTLVTADVGHHGFLAATEMGLNLLDCGHFATENVVTDAIIEALQKDFPLLTVFGSEKNKEPYQCL